MAETVNQHEAIPEDYPTEGDDAIWQRIEAYVAHRWTPRSVVWIVDGPGVWKPPLRPVVVAFWEAWDGAAWVSATVAEAPVGFGLNLCGPYRLTATVGAGPAPEAVAEAVQRLAGYLAAQDDMPAGARSYSANAGQLSESITRDPAHMGRALQNSGAADLLRAYRRV